jgi:cytochrome b6-f complex iron-sulfur subunit
MSCENCLTRRGFLIEAGKVVTLVAGASLAAGCGDGQLGPPATNDPGTPLPGGNSLVVTIADHAELQTIGRPVKVANDLAIVRTSTSGFAALSMVCTHQGCSTSIVGSNFDCPCHGSRFSGTGAVVRGPAESPLRTRPIVVDAQAGTITIA